MVRRHRALLLLAALAALLPHARAEGPTPAPAPAPAPGAPLLWELRGDGARVYVFATLHFPLSAVGPLPRVVTDALAASRACFGPLSPEELRGLHRKMLAHSMRFPRGLAEILPAPLYARLGRVLAARDLPLAFYARMRPWVAAGLLLVLDHPARGSGDRMMYEALGREAEQRKLPCLGLETVDEQIAAFESLTEPDQVAFLEAAVLRAEKAAKAGRKISEDLLPAYAAGDVPKVRERLAECVAPGEAGLRFRKLALEARSSRIADRIRQHAKARPGQTVFVHADATIVLGAGGLLVTLGKAGYAATRVAADATISR